MATEKRLIDANGVEFALIGICNRESGIPLAVAEWLANVVRNAPTVDAVEVVRCKNCQYWNPRYETMGMCMKHNSIVTFTKPDFFCAWGKDKNDGICEKG